MSRILVGSNFTGFKNRIINGDFSVWQRGESFVLGAGTSVYTADRLKTSNNSDGQFTVSKSALDNKDSLKITVDTAVTDLTLNKYWHGLIYKFEGQHLYDLAINAKNLTISFWFNSNVTGEYAVAFRNFTDTAVNIQSYVTSFNYTTANTPEKIQITIPLDAVWNPIILNNNAGGLNLVIGFLNKGDFVATSTNAWMDGNYITTSTAVNWGATAGNFIEIAELQLEEGSYATEFEHVPYDVQLLRCKRYYQVLWSDTINRYMHAGDSSDTAISHISIETDEMRTIPAIIDNGFKANGYQAGVLVDTYIAANVFPSIRGIGLRLDPEVATQTVGATIHFDWGAGSLHLDAEL